MDTNSGLSREQLDEFLEQGVLVVDNMLSPSELKEAREGLSRTLFEHGVNVHNLEETGHFVKDLSSTNGSGGVLDIFYPEWKMKVACNKRLFHATCQLWQAAYCHDGERQEDLDDSNMFQWHPYGPFDCKRGYMYIDRIGYRIPTNLAKKLGSGTTRKTKPIQRSLTPHLDCCPGNFFSKRASKWRPIQCFVSLTDNLEPNTGGFEAARGFHRNFHKWTRHESVIRKKTGEVVSFPPPCLGEYTHIRPAEDAEVMKQICHIPARAGSAVFWDNRIPHANAYRNDSTEPRAVVYCSFLPDVPLNRVYARRQLVDYQNRMPPTDQWINIESNDTQRSDQDEGMDSASDLAVSSLGRKLLGMDHW